MVVQTILKILLLFENLLDVHEIIQFDNNTFVIYLYRISIFFFGGYIWKIDSRSQNKYKNKYKIFIYHYDI